MKWLEWIGIIFWLLWIFWDPFAKIYSVLREKALRRRREKNMKEMQKSDEEGLFD